MEKYLKSNIHVQSGKENITFFLMKNMYHSQMVIKTLKGPVF